jgi:hypothetical protein
MNKIKINIKDYCELFGCTTEEIKEYCRSLVLENLYYRQLSKKERDELLFKIIREINSDIFSKAGAHRHKDWINGWQENLNEFVKDKCSDLATLIPKYYYKNGPIRYFGDYVMPISDSFVFKVTNIFRTYIFKKYLKHVDNIFEFGCGTAHHLAYMAKLYPEKKYYGLDWAISSQEIISLLRRNFRLDIQGINYDFFNIKNGLILGENSGVFTFGALEQVGTNHNHFINFLIEQKPKICINVECLHELYDLSKLSDYLGYQYHKKRKYLEGFLTKLRELEKEKIIKIFNVYHQKFGNVYNDTHSYVIWKPIR